MGFLASRPDLVTVEIRGLTELEATLNQLPEKIAKRILRQAVNKGAEVFRADAAARAPRGETFRPGRPKAWYERHPGKLAENIATRIAVKSQGVKGSEVIATVGLRLKPSQYNVFYGRFVERGTSKMGKKPFMRPAFDTKKDQVIEVIGTELGTKLEDAAQAAGSQKRPKL